MELLQFNFNHPVTGKVRLFNSVDPTATRVILLKEEDGGMIDVPLTGLCSGHWKAMLEWEYDGRNYYYAQEFEIP
jgi:hypothetical protein